VDVAGKCSKSDTHFRTNLIKMLFINVFGDDYDGRNRGLLSNLPCFRTYFAHQGTVFLLSGH
jgi:hypothetical protein